MTLEEYLLHKRTLKRECVLQQLDGWVAMFTPIHRGWMHTAGYGETREAQIDNAIENALNMVNTQIVTRR